MQYKCCTVLSTRLIKLIKEMNKILLEFTTKPKSTGENVSDFINMTTWTRSNTKT